jgi:hypothetical protein
LATLGVLLCCSPPGRAQLGGEREPSPGQVPAELVMSGCDYNARFDSGGLCFSAEGPQGLPLVLRFELDEVRLGELAIGFERGVEPRWIGERIGFQRGCLTEWYEPQAGGVEQSFEFLGLPDGAGDLLVAGRLLTDLPSVPVDQGLFFGWASGAGISVGAVTGIDADGNTTAGSLTLVGRRLEMRLPADFVAAARFPLLLDPLIGVSADGPQANQLGSPDVAHDEGADEYLMVFDRSTGLGNRSIFGQRVSGSGQLLGAAFDISNSPALLLRRAPRVANVDANNQFVVAWEQPTSDGGSEIAVRLVAVGSGALSTVKTVSRPAAAADGSPDIGGSSTNFIGFGQCAAMIVFGRSQGGLTSACSCRVQIQQPFGTELTLETPELLDNSGLVCDQPSISKTRDVSDRYCVVYEARTGLTAAEPSQLRAVLLGGDGDLGQTLTLPQSATDLTLPQVDGGRPLGGGPSRWMVVFEQRQVPVNGLQAPAALELTSAGSALNPSLLPGAVTQLAAYGSNLFHPSVAFTGQRFHVAAQGRVQLVGSALLEFSVRLFERSAEGGPWVQYSGPAETSLVPLGSVPNLALVSQWSGDSEPSAAKDQGLLIWVGKVEQPGTAVEPQIEFSLFQASGEAGTAEVLGGGCVGGGVPLLSGPPTLGTIGFEFELAGINQFVSAVLLNLEFSGGATFTCNTCVSLFPDLLIAATPVDNRAKLSLNLPTSPSLVGYAVHCNWFSIGYPSTLCPLYPGLVSSPILRLTFGQ